MIFAFSLPVFIFADFLSCVSRFADDYTEGKNLRSVFSPPFILCAFIKNNLKGASVSLPASATKVCRAEPPFGKHLHVTVWPGSSLPSFGLQGIHRAEQIQSWDQPTNLCSEVLRGPRGLILFWAPKCKENWASWLELSREPARWCRDWSIFSTRRGWERNCSAWRRGPKEESTWLCAVVQV